MHWILTNIKKSQKIPKEELNMERLNTELTYSRQIEKTKENDEKSNVGNYS